MSAKRVEFAMDGQCASVEVAFHREEGVSVVFVKHPSGQELVIHPGVLTFASACYQKAMQELSARGVQCLERVQ